MREKGLVIKTEGQFATVRVDKKDECSKCGMCVFPKNANYVDLTAENELNAKEGDRVEIDREERGKLLSITLVFLVPLILILISALVAYLLSISELWILVFSVVSSAIWYAVLALLEKKFKKLSLFNSQITRILSEENKKV